MADDEITWKQHAVSIPISRDGMDGARSLDYMKDAMADLYEEARNPRQGPRRRRVFRINPQPSSPQVRPWVELVIELYGCGPEGFEWDDIPEDLLAEIGEWDWDYYQPRAMTDILAEQIYSHYPLFERLKARADG